MKKKILFLIPLFIGIVLYNSQALEKDDIKSSSSWYRIKTPHYNIVFRGSFTREAQRMADTLEYLYIPIGASLGVKNESIDVLYENTNLLINGSTSRAKMIMYSFPPSDYNFAGAHDWLLFLTSHELRHVAQNNAEKKGLIKIIYWLGGDIFVSNYVNNISGTPRWFWEGDAVCIETALSNYGRGRLPYYLMNYKSILLEGSEFNYHKAFNRSYKDQVPNLYILGYVMTAHMRRNYGTDVIKNILYQMSYTTRLIFPIAVKKATGRSLSQVYKDANNELKQLWNKQLEGLKITPSETLSRPTNNEYRDYMHPQYSSVDKIISLRINRDGKYEFISINPRTYKEELIIEPYLLHERTSNFSVVENLIAWVELRYPILSEENRGVKNTAIVLYDISAKSKKRRVIAKGRYLSASISHSKKYIAAVVSNESYDHYISIIDIETGREIKKLKNPENKLYQAPTWSEDDRSIISVVAHNSKSSIESINIETDITSLIMDPSTEHIGNAVQHKNYIYYSSAYSGIDNIYAIDINTKKRYQITSKKYGAFSPNISPDGSYLYFSNYTKDGLHVERATLSSTDWLPIEQVKDVAIHYEKPIEEQEGNLKISPDSIPHKEYKIERYYPILHLFKINGWMLDAVEWIFGAFASKKEEVSPYFRVTIKFEDLNNWLTQSYSYRFMLKDKGGEISAEYRLPSIYPQISFAGSLIHQASNLTDKLFKGRIATPLNFPLGHLDSVFTPSICPKIAWSDNKHESKPRVKSSEAWYVDYSLDYIVTGNSSPYYIVNPRKFHIGGIYQTVDQTKQIAKKEKKYQSSCWGAQIKFSIPSFIDNNVFIFKSVYQLKNPSQEQSKGYKQSKRQEGNIKGNLEFIRNLKCRPLDSYVGEIFSNRVSYVFPIYYPDIDLGYLSYFQRISSTMFMELTHFPDATLFKKILTIGLDVYFQFNILSRDPGRDTNRPINLYLGYSYTPNVFEDIENDDRHKFSINLRLQHEGALKKVDIYENEEKGKSRNNRYRAGYQG
jgi:hypothetical protein